MSWEVLFTWKQHINKHSKSALQNGANTNYNFGHFRNFTKLETSKYIIKSNLKDEEIYLIMRGYVRDFLIIHMSRSHKFLSMKV